MKRAYVEIRSQHSRGSSAHQFGGPDAYVAVQVVPDGAERLTCLREDMARKRGIEIRHFGQGYRQHNGPRSMFGQALEAAEAYAAEINGAA